jgi:hypothetical protein
MEMVEREVEGEPPLTRSLTFRKEHPGEMVCWFNLKTYKVYKVQWLRRCLLEASPKERLETHSYQASEETTNLVASCKQRDLEIPLPLAETLGIFDGLV